MARELSLNLFVVGSLVAGKKRERKAEAQVLCSRSPIRLAPYMGIAYMGIASQTFDVGPMDWLGVCRGASGLRASVLCRG